MNSIIRRVEWIAWWIGIPILVGLLSYGPFVLIRCSTSSLFGGSCLHFVSVSQLVFDLRAYMEFMGAILSNAPTISMPWMSSAIRSAHSLFPSATIVELWLGFRWAFGVISIWMFSWVVSKVINAPQRFRRMTALLLWMAVFLPLGFRPGVFSWFLPFGLFAFVTSLFAVRSLKERAWMKVFGWSCIALLASTAYSWFMLFFAFWLGAVWGMWIINRLRVSRVAFVWAFLSTSAVTVSFLVDRFFPVHVQMFFQTYLRNGMGFTRLIQISGMLISALCWLICVVIASRRAQPESKEAFERMGIVWIVTIAGWCSSVATGIYLHNDHFRIFVLLFAWMSTIVLIRYGSMVHLKSRLERILLTCIGFFSLIQVLLIVIGPYSFDGDQLNVIHLFVWGSLVVSSWVLLNSPSEPFRSMKSKIAIAFACCLIGVLPYVQMFVRENIEFATLRSYDASLDWIMSSIPRSDTICVDPTISEFIGAFSGRRVFFTQQEIYSSGTDADLYERIQILSSLTNVEASSTKIIWTQWLNARGVPCSQFSLYHSLLAPMIGRDRFDRLSGCDREKMNAEDQWISQLKNNFKSKDMVSGALCPWIVYPPDHALDWSTDQYMLRYEDAMIRIEQRI